MAINCSFILNGMPSSILHCQDVGDFPAFSGQKAGRDAPDLTAVPDIGPIPEGQYFIVGRQSGGFLSPIREAYLKYVYGADRGEWFSLYRNDGRISDMMYINGVKRGHFRLHPIGPMGLSEGCITLNYIPDFEYLRKKLLATKMIDIPGSTLKAYGTVWVSK